MMEVIGEDGVVYDVDDDMLEGVGYAGPMGEDDEDDEEDEVEGDVLGYTDAGYAIVGKKRRKRRRRARPRRRVAVARIRQPPWRRSQLAPGVIAPDQGLLPLPLAGSPSNTFALATQNITFVGQVQKPFAGERLLVNVVRTGTTATGLLLAQIYVGTDLQQLDVARVNLEAIGDPNAFGVRLRMKPCQPGVDIKIDTTLSTPLTTTDTIFASVTLLGRYIG